MALLSTRPNEAKICDKVRDCCVHGWPPLSDQPPRAAFYSVSALVRLLTTCVVRLPLPCAAW